MGAKKRTKDLLRDILFRVPIVGPRYREMRQAAAALYRINPGHYSSPIPSDADIEREVVAVQQDALYDDGLPGIPVRTLAQLDLLRQLSDLIAMHPFVDEPSIDKHGPRYHFKNNWFQFTDGLILHGLMRLMRPRRIIEIGSGFSSAVILDTLDHDQSLNTELTMIDPNCDRLRSQLRIGDEASVTLIDAELQSVSLDRFDALGPSDFLLVDSSHISRCGSDVNLIVHEILPRLSSGVMVHFHDIFFSFRYPRRLLNNGHFWSEAYILRAFLEMNEKFQIKLWNDYLKIHHSESLHAGLHGSSDDIAASLWLARI